MALEKSGLSGGGTQAAAWAAGGDGNSTIYNKTEEYNGTAWSAGGNQVTGRNSAAGAGTLSAGLCMGGAVSPKTQTEEYTAPGPGQYSTLFTGHGSL